ncbi:MAG: hypothetical protein NZ602_14055 [Thermoguttaceae bacterium]|nr:hypothetical protein [Thermoguttaceae bacterium]MDW8039409.1 hypothetical protein [Thermoguttaceae bacterium]
MNRKRTWWKVAGLLFVWLHPEALLGEEEPGGPGGTQSLVVEAEEGQILSGKLLRQEHPAAHGGAYVEAVSEEPVRLMYTIRLAQPGYYRLIPIFWRNSVRTPPRFFPFPIPRSFGPDALAALESRFFFTAPASGRIGLLDLEGNLIEQIELGGYVTDILADSARKRLLVADAAGGRIVVVNAQTKQVVLEKAVPGVWQLAMARGRWGLTEEHEVVFAASRANRRLYLLDAKTLEVLQEYALPAGAVHMSIVGGPEAELRLGLEPTVYRLEDWQLVSADRWDYGFGGGRSAEWGTRGGVGWTRFTITTEGIQMTVRTAQGDQSRRLALPIQGKPMELAVVGTRLVIATDKGTVYVVDPAGEKVLAGLPITEGRVAMAVVGARVYATDSVRNELAVVEVLEGKISGRIAVPAGPVAVAGYEPVWWTKDYVSGSLVFVACQKAKLVAVVDIATGRVTRTLPVGFEPAAVQVVLPPNPEWWPETPSERLGMEQSVRLAVLPRPMILRQDGKFVPSDQIISLPLQPHNQVSLKQPDGMEITLLADNNHTLRYRQVRKGGPFTERWIDVSQVTDTPGAAPMVDPGAICVAGQPWHRDIWMSPDQQLFLVADSEEFWQWNAPVVQFEKVDGSVEVKIKPQVQLDGLRLEPVPPVELQIVGDGPAEVPPRYRAVFYADEPVRLKLALRLTQPRDRLVGRIEAQIFNYMDEQVWSGDWQEVLGSGQPASQRLVEVPLRQTGVFRLEAEFRCPEGRSPKRFYFLRMPRLERPRLLARPAQWAEAKTIMARYPLLFQRYFQWLGEQMQTVGFLPSSLVRAEFLSELPPEQKKMHEQGGWRRYDFAWRLLGVELAAGLLTEPERNPFHHTIHQVLRSGRTEAYCHFHHHGPFFPGFDAAFLDLAAAELGEQSEPIRRLREFMATRLGDMNVLAWTLAAMQDPPTPRERMLLWELMTWRVNAERYFTIHAGRRGGTWWLNHRTGCHCPFAAYAYAFLYLRHFFGEERLHERTFIQGFLSHAQLTRPRKDARGIFGPESPPGEPQRWITFALSRHPLTETIYNWRPMVDRLQQPVSPSPEELSRFFSFPTGANHNMPTPFVLPLGLALGWYDPQMPQVGWEELPPTVLFDGEGEVVMRSDYSPQATELFFACGIRDHVYRHQPTHLMIFKAGEPLLATASFWGDHGCPSLAISQGNSWGNVVVIEPSDWQSRWKNNFFHPRGEELALVNRFTNATFRRLVREQRLVGYVPAEGGFGGGLNLHGHTETFLHREGHLIAFETHPAFDYVAGDATLSWLPDQAQRVVRQVVFVRPDVVVVYDRVRLGPKAQRAYWVAATGLQLQTEHNRFMVQSGQAFLNGLVLLPAQVQLAILDPAKSEKYAPLFDKRAFMLKVLEVHPPALPKPEPASKRLIEFLTVMRIGLDGQPKLTGSVQLVEDQLQVKLEVEDRHVEIGFDRGELCTGQIWIRPSTSQAAANATESVQIRHRFSEKLDDTYEHWNKDPRYPLWQTDPRFRFLAISRSRADQN